MSDQKRLINANDLSEVIEEIDWYSINCVEGLTLGASSEEYVWYKAKDIYHAIENAPTVDAVEVVHGSWLPCGFGKEIMCSACRCELGDLWEYRYCPNCGAKMDGDGNA